MYGPFFNPAFPAYQQGSPFVFYHPDEGQQEVLYSHRNPAGRSLEQVCVPQAISNTEHLKMKAWFRKFSSPGAA
jgi:hypothetical protein